MSDALQAETIVAVARTSFLMPVTEDTVLNRVSGSPHKAAKFQRCMRVMRAFLRPQPWPTVHPRTRTAGGTRNRLDNDSLMRRSSTCHIGVYGVSQPRADLGRRFCCPSRTLRLNGYESPFAPSFPGAHDFYRPRSAGDGALLSCNVQPKKKWISSAWILLCCCCFVMQTT